MGSQQRMTAGRARRGRPPSERAHRAILEAARAVLAEQDLAHLNIERVAAIAGVGKATVYRHWPTREALALDLLLDMVGGMGPARDRGDTRVELIAMLEGTVRVLTESPLGHVMQAAFTQLALSPQLAEPFRARRAAVGQILARGIERGHIRPDADVDIATELLIGPVYYRLLFGPGFPPDFPARIVDALLGGYAFGRSG